MAQSLRSIGQVLSVLKGDFPEISISKIRFLEAEGLISPERAPSGYRRYRSDDVERLRYVLTVQKDHYLPLKVIREHLEQIDNGLEPPALETPKPVAPGPEPMGDAEAPAVVPKRPMRISRRELLDVSGLAEATLFELERQLIIKPKRGTSYYGREALTVAVIARKLAPFGMDARHLRVIKHAAEREMGLVEQAVAPYTRRQDAGRETAEELRQLVMHAHAALMKSMLDR